MFSHVLTTQMCFDKLEAALALAIYNVHINCQGVTQNPINMDPGRGELVLRVEILLVASYSSYSLLNRPEIAYTSISFITYVWVL